MSLIDEQLLTLSAAAKRLPGRRPGKHLHRSQLDRWTNRGLNGIKLESIRLGQKYTSVEALDRFADAIERHRSGDDSLPLPISVSSASQQAGEELDRLL